MPLEILREDLVRMRVDAIVNPSNEELFPGGGLDAAIHRAAGSELLAACEALGGVAVGHAVITPGFRLPCRYVIHTAGPVWKDGTQGEEELLMSCYRTALQLAHAYACESIAFPLISSGLYGYPKDRVLRVAVDVIAEFLATHEMQVYLVVFDKTAYWLSERLFSDVTSFIDDNYVQAHADRLTRREKRRRASPAYFGSAAQAVDRPAEDIAPISVPPLSLEEMILSMDDSFAVMLLKLIDLKGMEDVACYKKANVSKQTWHKILNEKNYRPSKNTVLSFAIALELTLEETKSLLATVGYALSRSSKFDVIVTYFLINRNYDIYEIDATLFRFDQPTLGALS